MTWRVSKTFRFEAAHKLPHHDGKCQRLHGHSYVMDITFQDDTLHTTGPKQGMVIDFGDISKVVKPLVNSHLDHHYLNDTLGEENPTAEVIARWIWDELIDKLPGLASVTIHETCTSAVTYEGARV